MTPEQFADLVKQGYNRIPVTREILADLETPLSCYLKLARGPYSYLFESVEGGEKWGRYSLIGLPSATIFKVCDNHLSIECDGVVLEAWETNDPLAEVEAFAQRYRVPELPDMPRFTGGLVGYFGYDTVRYIEPRLAASCPPDELGVPDILLMASHEVLVFDNLHGKLIFIVHADGRDPDAWNKAQIRLDALEAGLRHPVPALDKITLSPGGAGEAVFTSSFGQARFEQVVDKIKDYIVAGDAMQVVPSQRLSLPFSAPAINLYRALRILNPSPYMYFLDLDGFEIVGSSPEILSHLEDGLVTVRPLAGSRPRGASLEEDIALEKELLADPKEVAEHLMLIDLGRNDVGRVAEVGSVRLTEKMVVERYSHIMHISSTVVGSVKPDTSAIDVLRATLPAGTLSGAPKIRAMEIIDEFEPVKRCIYAGAVGYLGWNGNMDT
ncbi:MAG TPA: anthranilate synthase component I, partial [Porticoccaceae bacterium]|nr:anthranilate synthase component I [Porticoccaceae bacterium]